MTPVIILSSSFGETGTTQILTWTDSDDTVKTYYVRRRGPGEQWSIVAGVRARQIWTDTTAILGISYDYQIITWVFTVTRTLGNPIARARVLAQSNILTIALAPPYLVNPPDPVPPPPYTAIQGYRLVLLGYDTGGVHLTVTFPYVSIEGAVEELSPLEMRVSMSSYESGDTQASQTGDVLTLSGGSVRFAPDSETPNSIGQIIVWDPIILEATITSVPQTPADGLGAMTAIVTPSQDIGLAGFSMFPPNTVFELWAKWSGSLADFSKWGDSEGGGTAQFNRHPAYFTVTTDQFGDPFPVNPATFYFYIKGVSDSSEVVSNIVTILYQP